jgi:hypothetical protein
VDADLHTLGIALCARTDDLPRAFPERAPWRPKGGLSPQASEAELLTFALLRALLGFTSGVPLTAVRLRAGPTCSARHATANPSGSGAAG